MKNHLILGNWNALCDSCGRKFKALDLQKRWDGLMVCKEDWEMRHPSDFLRVQKEKINVEFSRPYPAQDTYLPENLWINTNDNLGIPEQVAFTVSKPRTESIGLTELFIASLGRSFTESIASAETTVKSTNKRITESVPISETLYFTEAAHAVESMSFSETKVLSTNKGVSESISVTESVSSSLLKGSAINGAALNTYNLG